MSAAAIAAARGDARRECRGWRCRLVRDAILRFVPADAPARYQVRLAVERGQLRDAIQRLTVSP